MGVGEKGVMRQYLLNKDTHTRSHTNVHIHTCTHKQTNAYTCTKVYTHINTHTHTKAQIQGLTFIWTVIGQMSWTTQIQ